VFAERALRAGAAGYINKQALQNHVVEAIHAVLRGERYLSSAMSQRLMAQAIQGKAERSGIDALSDRELQIFELIGEGRSTSEIAKRLHLSIHTIETHREKIRAKLGLRNGTELMLRAVQWQLHRGGEEDETTLSD
jgi:DNA-binding NarL/FixJ family response regulator